jgi:hypothetical protein
VTGGCRGTQLKYHNRFLSTNAFVFLELAQPLMVTSLPVKATEVTKNCSICLRTLLGKSRASSSVLNASCQLGVAMMRLLTFGFDLPLRCSTSTIPRILQGRMAARNEPAQIRTLKFWPARKSDGKRGGGGCPFPSIAYCQSQ